MTKCPRCGGHLSTTRIERGERAKCVVCGHREYVGEVHTGPPARREARMTRLRSALEAVPQP